MSLVDASTAAQFDRLPPHSIQAEMCLIGSLMLDKSAVPIIRGIVDRESFYQADHQIIFDVIIDMFDKKAPLDPVTLFEELGMRQLAEEVGGAKYLGLCLNTVPSAAHVEYYAKIIREKAMLRHLISLSNECLRDAYAPHLIDSPAEMLMKFSEKAMKVAMQGSASNIRHISQIVPEVIAARTAKNATRLPTAIKTFDDITGGLPLGQNVIIAGRSYMGKSALLKLLAHNYAWQEIKVGLISIEEAGLKICQNLLSMMSAVPNNRIAFNTVSADEWPSVERAAAELSKLGIWIEDASCKLSDIEAAAHVLKAKHGCQVIMIDHLHLIDGQSDENRNIELGKISKGVKLLWKSLNVVGISAAQMNRTNGGSSEARPTLDGLRDSGTLGQDADIAILLHREDYYRRKEPGYVPNHLIELIVEKNKDGAPGTATLYYDEARYVMRDLEPSEDQNIPSFDWSNR
jgi:replicative DNA helicase